MQSELFTAAIDVFGEEKQIFKTIEECSELIRALAINMLGNDNIENVIDEIADVFIMVNQMRIVFGSEEVDARIKFKLERLANLLGVKSEEG